MGDKYIEIQMYRLYNSCPCEYINPSEVGNINMAQGLNLRAGNATW